MPIRLRVPKARKLTPELRVKAVRLLELSRAHRLAIVDARPETQTFYRTVGTSNSSS